jgi:hypothetical protein
MRGQKADTLAVVRSSDIFIRLEIPIRIYRVTREGKELLTKKTLDEIDLEAHRKALEAYSRGDRQAFKDTIVEAVRRWVETGGGKLLACVELDDDLEFLIKTTA